MFHFDLPHRKQFEIQAVIEYQFKALGLGASVSDQGTKGKEELALSLGHYI
jgi:hypothetical protein